MARLLFSQGDQLLVEHKLRPGRTTLGRADTCDISLPGEALSRTHCIIDGQGESWEIIDRSRHGTLLDGKPVRRGALRDGTMIEIGPYEVQFRLADRADHAMPTAEALSPRTHERVLSLDESGLKIERSALVVESGPDEGRRYELKSSRASIGAAPSTIALSDPGLVPDHCRVRVAQGRVMVEPGLGPTFLEGVRIREITPLYAGEEICLGETVLRVEVGLAEERPVASRFGDMVGQSDTMKKLFGSLRRVAAHEFPVLLTGESGTGKELAARGIHEHSPRASGPFIPVNCGAIPEGLFESELFGHERGAFSGAVRRADGAFQRADHGTLFLDEVGELPESAQAKLLRALESGEVRRVGGEQVEFPDVRIVAATNRDLASEVRQGLFREDLFFRLAVLSVHMPPLAERMSDLEALCTALCKALNPDAVVTAEALKVLSMHDWPGNVRELRNVLTRAFVLGGTRIEPQHLSFHTLSRPARSPLAMRALGMTLDPSAAPAGAAEITDVEEAERAWLIAALKKHGENRSAVARELGMARSSLLYKLRRYGLM